MKVNFFLDLELTIFQSWYDPCYITANCDYIAEQIKRFDPKDVNVIIWSFAIDGMRDMDTFERLHKKNVEDKIGFKVKLVVPMQRMVQDICLANGLSFDTIDFSSVYTKDWSFTKWALQKRQGALNVLFDDTVRSQLVVDQDSKTVCQLINVNKPKCVLSQERALELLGVFDA